MVKMKSFGDTGPKLYLCSTPIGNLDDVTPRLLETLASAEMLAAEDTRQTRKLLSRYQIHAKRLISFHEHNSNHRLPILVSAWENGDSVALVTDAGTPCVSDPGQSAVRAAIQMGVPVIPIPGASAVLSALVVSGLTSERFAFHGFLSRDKKNARRELAAYQHYQGSLVIYEAPHRLQTTLQLVKEMFPNCPMAVCKELTKQHETVWRGSVEEIESEISSEEIRGEFVLVLDLAEYALSSTVMDTEKESLDKQMAEESPLEYALDEVNVAMAEGQSMRDAVREVAKRLAVSRSQLYQLALKQLSQGDS